MTVSSWFGRNIVGALQNPRTSRVRACRGSSQGERAIGARVLIWLNPHKAREVMTGHI